MLVVGAAIMWLADHWGPKRLLEIDLTFPKALGLGFAQALALIPGVSRSGISISAGLFAGLNRESAARFSFLMATPITAAAAAYESFKLVRGELGVQVEVLPLLAGMLAALISGLLAIGFLLRFLRTRSLNVFVAYRIVLAAVVLVVFLR
jgi:undecaprenyl-diphosphatase